MTPPTQPTIVLNDGNAIPTVGLGVWQTPPEETQRAVEAALSTGYRHIDTAAVYGNESEVGHAIKASGVPREEVFLVTKLWNADQGYDKGLKAFDVSAERLGVDYVDLYLIHWPVPAANLFVDSFKALAHLREQGRVRSIGGVSNFAPRASAHADRRYRDRPPPSTRSNCTRVCRSRNCGRCTWSWASPPRPGAAGPGRTTQRPGGDHRGGHALQNTCRCSSDGTSSWVIS